MCEHNPLLFIGAGSPRTGTLTLKKALEIIYKQPCYHMTELMYNHPDHSPLWELMFEASLIVGKPVANEKWISEIFKDYGAVTDAPACALYEPMIHMYPDAKIILTVRDPKAWLESVRCTVIPKYELNGQSLTEKIAGWAVFPPRFFKMVNGVWKLCFGSNIDLTNDEQLVKAFNKWNMEVQSRVPKNRLLVYEVKSGWKPLCDFLNVPIPDEPFPHVNDRVSFEKYVKSFKRMKRLINIGWSLIGIGLIGLCLQYFELY